MPWALLDACSVGHLCRQSTGNTHTLMDGSAIPKADVIAAGGPDLSHVNMFRNFEVESFPATDLNPNKALSDPEVFLNKQFPADTTPGPITQLCLHKITWSSPTSDVAAVFS
jgi:hypothetical protein